MLHEFAADFYGEELRLVVTGYLRPERNFSSLDSLVAAIHADIRLATESLATPPHAALRADPFLRPPPASLPPSGGAAP